MRATRGFTLTEMLAVMGIAVILIGGSVGALVAVAGHIGPENGAMVLQSMLNATRAYAASNAVDTRLGITSTTQQAERGAQLRIEYLDVDTDRWKPVENLKPVSLGKGLFVLNGVSNALASLAQPDPPADPANVTPGERRAWERYHDRLLNRLGAFAFQSYDMQTGIIDLDRDFKGTHKNTFYVYFDPAGYLSPEPGPRAVDQALIIIQVGGRRITEHMFYPLNPNSGTRLVFD